MYLTARVSRRKETFWKRERGGRQPLIQPSPSLECPASPPPLFLLSTYPLSSFLGAAQAMKGAFWRGKVFGMEHRGGEGNVRLC